MNLMTFSFSESKFMNDVSYVSKATKYPRRPLTFREKVRHFFSGEYCIKYQPPEEISGKKTLVLDLDDTLIHASLTPPNGNLHYFRYNNYYIFLRPGLKKFLDFCHKNYDLFIFTAAEQDYADFIINRICPYVTKDHRLYRDSCYKEGGFLIKDLNIFKRSPNDIILIDDSLNTFITNRDNCIQIERWTGYHGDRNLKSDILTILQRCLEVKDVRPVLSHTRTLRRHSYAYAFD